MATEFFPFDAGTGANITEPQWQKMARLWQRTGVVRDYLNALAPSADGLDMTVDVASGAAWIEGFYFGSDAVVALTIAAADAANPRIDTVVVELATASDAITLKVITGTAATSPVAPGLTQTDSLYQYPLADVRVAAATSVIAASAVTDRRTFVAAASHSDLLDLGADDHPQYLKKSSGPFLKETGGALTGNISFPEGHRVKFTDPGTAKVFSIFADDRGNLNFYEDSNGDGADDLAVLQFINGRPWSGRAMSPSLAGDLVAKHYVDSIAGKDARGVYQGNGFTYQYIECGFTPRIVMIHSSSGHATLYISEINSLFTSFISPTYGVEMSPDKLYPYNTGFIAMAAGANSNPYGPNASGQYFYWQAW